jgi:PAS domain S-box-containing protein
MRLGESHLRANWQPGAWFFIISLQSYVIAIGLIYLLFTQVGKSIQLPRWRGLLIVNVLVIITGAMTLDTFGYYLAPGLLNVPIGLGLMDLTLIIGIWYIDLFDVLPIARETLTRYMPDGIFVLDTNNIVLDANPAATRLLNLPISDVIGKDIVGFAFSEERMRQISKIVKGEFHGIQPLTVHGQDRFFDVLVTNIYIEGGIVAAKLLVLRDVDELKQLQEQDIHRIALEERQRLSRDLHDAVSQTLFSARVTSEMLLQQKKTISSRALWKNINHFAGLVKSALGEMRILLLELRPESLVNAELPILLSHLVDAASSRIDAKIILDVHGKYELPVDVKIAFYRIAQESLNNIIKHAGSTKVNIQLINDPAHVKLVIGDNGIGLGTGEARRSQMGLSIMRERANEVGAGLEITSQPNLGTQVACTWKAHGS